MHRFFLPPALLTGSSVQFPLETAHQIRAVLRLRPGAVVVALDNLGSEFEVELAQVSAERVSGEVKTRRPAPGEPRIHLTLYLGLTQREKFEWILQKCTEVGVSTFVPFISSRSLVQDTHDSAKKAERWQRILQEAAEQSGRGRIPTLHQPLRYEQAIQHAAQNTRALIAWEGEQGQGLRSLLPAPELAMRIGLFIGPEGGFSSAEVELARTEGILPFTLGSRILRMETAALVASALVLHQLGEMGNSTT